MKLQIGHVYQNGRGSRYIIIGKNHPKMRRDWLNFMEDGLFIGIRLGTEKDRYPDWELWHDDGSLYQAGSDEEEQKFGLKREIMVLNI